MPSSKSGPKTKIPTAAGERNHPRSLELVLRAIRKQLGISQEKMFFEICKAAAPFSLPPGTERILERSENAKDCTSIEKAKNSRTSSVSNWERGVSEMPFSLQFAYGAVSETRNGIVHLVSCYYADLRDAVDLKKARQTRKFRMDKAKDNILQLEAFLNTYKSLVKDLENGKLNDELENENATPKDEDKHIAIINRMLNAYRDGSRRSG